MVTPPYAPASWPVLRLAGSRASFVPRSSRRPLRASGRSGAGAVAVPVGVGDGDGHDRLRDADVVVAGWAGWGFESGLRTTRLPPALNPTLVNVNPREQPTRPHHGPVGDASGAVLWLEDGPSWPAASGRSWVEAVARRRPRVAVPRCRLTEYSRNRVRPVRPCGPSAVSADLNVL